MQRQTNKIQKNIKINYKKKKLKKYKICNKIMKFFQNNNKIFKKKKSKNKY